jgi:hypothetical protein
MIINNTLSQNRTCYGGGIYFDSSSSTVVNSILIADYSEYGVDEIQMYHSSPTILFSDIWGGWSGQGNISVNPLFRDPANGDFHLMSSFCGDSLNSPGIDAGDPAIYDGLLSCSWGLGTMLSDMGAYGGGDSMLVGIDNRNTQTPFEFALNDNYPNPFNLSTLISYDLIRPSNVTLDIYDILGSRISTLINENQLLGSHSIVWDAKDAPSGIYLYRIHAGDLTQTKKMTLIK